MIISYYTARAYRSKINETRKYYLVHLGKFRCERANRLKYWLRKNYIDRLPLNSV